jgi:hypothetical protein
VQYPYKPVLLAMQLVEYDISRVPKFPKTMHLNDIIQIAESASIKRFGLILFFLLLVGEV